MIPSIPQSRGFQRTYNLYVSLFFLFLLAPLVVVAIFSLNDSVFPSLPWEGFTLDWYLADDRVRRGLFHDSAILDSIGVSLTVAIMLIIAKAVRDRFSLFKFAFLANFL